MAAKWMTASNLCRRKTASRPAASRRSSLYEAVNAAPAIFSTRTSASGELLAWLSTTTTRYPCCSSSTQVWLPMKPAPPVTRTVGASWLDAVVIGASSAGLGIFGGPAAVAGSAVVDAEHVGHVPGDGEAQAGEREQPQDQRQPDDAQGIAEPLAGVAR